MPADVEFMIRESRNWFARSPLKKLQYQDLNKAINNGKMPQNLVQLVKTRWLAWARAIEVILQQWVELKQHFTNNCLQFEAAEPSEKCVLARKLRDCFSEQNYLLLLFLYPITAELNRINLKFHSSDAEVAPSGTKITALSIHCVGHFPIWRVKWANFVVGS
ncbi:Transport inhibitor response 1-like protein [Frankliniella fusca]|uniref:Transport inhibitor response 1-like protein n=1 Tax=Frankliniella fusca TaxID=407009 RepID=A0AAE1HHY3_9NEOP|nr:Transport inhibitor response 1-like protein [Frankliniella fusca]